MGRYYIFQNDSTCKKIALTRWVNSLEGDGKPQPDYRIKVGTYSLLGDSKPVRELISFRDEVCAS